VDRAEYGFIRYRVDIPKLHSRRSRALSSWSCSTPRSLTFLSQSVHLLRSRLQFFFQELTRLSQTQRYVRIYNLSEQKLLKTLTPGIRWISSMDVHPSGVHLIVGGYDRKLCWFDLELSEKPYKILRYAKLLYDHMPGSFTYTPVDIILVRSGHCIFIPHIRCSLRHQTTGRSRSSTHVCTVTSSQTHSSYRSRSCVGMTYVRG
jgi:WD40 repeat protein